MDRIRENWSFDSDFYEVLNRFNAQPKEVEFVLNYPKARLVQFAFGLLEPVETARVKLEFKKSPLLKLMYEGIGAIIRKNKMNHIEDYEAHISRRTANAGVLKI